MKSPYQEILRLLPGVEAIYELEDIREQARQLLVKLQSPTAELSVRQFVQAQVVGGSR